MAVMLLSIPMNVRAGWDEIAVLARGLADGTFVLDRYSFIQPSSFTSAIFFDYDNDGELDLLMMGQGGDWNIRGDVKFMLLYHNEGASADYSFRRVSDTGLLQRVDNTFINPLGACDIDHDGYTDLVVMSNDGIRHVDIYYNDGGSGHFTMQSLANPASNGSVALGDVNNDGWTDLLFTGQNGSGKPEARLYVNNADRTFHDATPSNLTATCQGQSALVDIDGGGWLDIVVSGIDADNVKTAGIYLNMGREGSQGFRAPDTGTNGLKGASRANILAADFNADGTMDIIMNGEADDNTGFRNRIYYQDASGVFHMDSRYPLMPVNGDGAINMGDADGDGNMDVIIAGWIGDHDDGINYFASPMRVYYNCPEKASISGNTRPTPPLSVNATMKDGMIDIEWTSGHDLESKDEALRYNIYVRNNTIGRTWMLIPSDEESGNLRVGTDLATAIAAGVGHYRMASLGDGDYIVGAQTLDQSFAGSKFSVTKCTVINGIASVASIGTQEKCYTISGQQVENLNTKGIYIINGKKIIR